MIADLITVLAEYGIASTLTIISLVIIYKAIKTAYDNSQDREQIASDDRFEGNRVDLSKHEFFNNTEFKINIDLPIESFSEDEARNILYRDIMIFLFTAYHDNMKKFVSNLDEYWTTEEWREKLIQTHYGIIEDFNTLCERNAVPEVAIKLFMEWYTPYIHRVYQYINSVSKLPESNGIIDRTRFFLLVLELIMVTVTADAQRFKKINGQLDGIEYKGITL